MQDVCLPCAERGRESAPGARRRVVGAPLARSTEGTCSIFVRTGSSLCRISASGVEAGQRRRGPPSRRPAPGRQGQGPARGCAGRGVPLAGWCRRRLAECPLVAGTYQAGGRSGQPPQTIGGSPGGRKRAYGRSVSGRMASRPHAGAAVAGKVHTRRSSAGEPAWPRSSGAAAALLVSPAASSVLAPSAPVSASSAQLSPALSASSTSS